MEQHLKTDLKILVKEPDKTGLTRVGVPANVVKETTEAQALAVADIMAPIFPKEVAVSSVLLTGQTSYIKAPPAK